MLVFFCLQKEKFILHVLGRAIVIRPKIEWKRDKQKQRKADGLCSSSSRFCRDAIKIIAFLKNWLPLCSAALSHLAGYFTPIYKMLPYTTCLRGVGSGGTQHSRLVIAFYVTKLILWSGNPGTRKDSGEGRGFDQFWAKEKGVIQSMDRGSLLPCRCGKGRVDFSTRYGQTCLAVATFPYQPFIGLHQYLLQ